MKRKIIQLCAVAVFLFSGSAVYAKPANNGTNEVEITEVADLLLGNSIEKIWKLSYSKQEVPVTVALRVLPNRTEYIVRSEFFEIIYANDRNGFGVRKMHSSLKEVPDLINYAVLNQNQLQQQKILTPNKVSDEYALGLISAYLPDLLNKGYQHLLY